MSNQLPPAKQLPPPAPASAETTKRNREEIHRVRDMVALQLAELFYRQAVHNLKNRREKDNGNLTPGLGKVYDEPDEKTNSYN
jgi:hypothetical protein